MKTFNTTGIVLRRSDYMEHDRLFSIFTRDFGKIDVIAKGTKRMLSKLNPHLEPLTHVSIMVAKGRGFDKLANAVTIDSFLPLKYHGDLHLTGLLHYALEVTDKLLYADYRDQRVYDNLVAWLQWVSRGSFEAGGADQRAFMVNAYIAKLLTILGFKPELRRCVECSRGILFPKLIYDFIKGGIICEHCREITIISEHFEITDAVIKILNLTMGEGFESLDTYQFNPIDLKDYNNIVYKLALYQIDKPLISTELLKFLQTPSPQL